ncbi:MAG: hypothetical protein HUU15_14600, partial [Candidatus Brocadiae bacterium]|nr:hypothetical protein [Candidatus Brocadiia bacterium]
MKVWDQVRYSTQEQLEKDRSFSPDSSDEGDLLAGGYPPIVSMPEYVYNPATNPVHYRSQTGDVSWCADYEGYLILNGPAKVQAGISPGPAAPGSSSGVASAACWGPNTTKYKGSPVPTGSPTKCGVSFVAGFNNANVYVNQSHRKVWHDAPYSFSGTGGGARHPEYDYSSPHCFADGASMSAQRLHSVSPDTGYHSASSAGVLKPYQIEPTAAASGWSWGGAAGGTGANFWDNGTDLQNFGIYINWLRRNRFHTYWADEVPSPDCTIEMTVKPEIDLWTWSTNSKMHTSSSMWGGGYKIWPCKRQFLYDWGVGGTKGMNYTIRCYVELFRVYLELYHHTTNQFYVMYADHTWKPHTWHHVETSWIGSYNVVLADGTVVVVPPNAMLFVDGQSAGSGGSDDHILASKFGAGTRDVSQVLLGTYAAQAMRLEFNVAPTWPNNDYGTGPRFDVGSTLANDGIFGMSSPRWIGIIDNIVMHHWRSHTATFTPRNRYHSSTYYDGSSFTSGKG